MSRAGARVSRVTSLEVTFPPPTVSAPVTQAHWPSTSVWYLKETWYLWPATKGTVAGTVR